MYAHRAELEFNRRFYAFMGFVFGWLTARILDQQLATLNKISEEDAKKA
jgi:hypothetical protein